MTVPESTGDALSLTAALRQYKWKSQAVYPGHYQVWQFGDDDRHQILVPLDAGRGDYNALISRARDLLVRRYGQTAAALLRTLDKRASSLESTHWKKETTWESGFIGFDEGLALHAAVRAQLVAAAKAHREPRRYHGNASAHLAKRFLESTLMGQSGAGSYVINAFTPSDEQFFSTRAEEDSFDPRQPQYLQPVPVSGGEILDTLERALTAVREGVDEYASSNRLDVFAEAVAEGVSHELLAAIGAFAYDGDSAVELTRRARPGGNQRSVEIPFDAVESPLLFTAANFLVQSPDATSVTLTGDVALLSRDARSARTTIRLHVLEGAEIRKARVPLDAQQYELALEAHRREAALRLSGSLQREGNLYWLYNARDVEIVDEADSLV